MVVETVCPLIPTVSWTASGRRVPWSSDGGSGTRTGKGLGKLPCGPPTAQETLLRPARSPTRTGAALANPPPPRPPPAPTLHPAPRAPRPAAAAHQAGHAVSLPHQDRHHLQEERVRTTRGRGPPRPRPDGGPPTPPAPCPRGTPPRRPHTGSGSGSSFRDHRSRCWGPRFCRRPGSALGGRRGARARPRGDGPPERRGGARVTQLGADQALAPPR